VGGVRLLAPQHLDQSIRAGQPQRGRRGRFRRDRRGVILGRGASSAAARRPAHRAGATGRGGSGRAGGASAPAAGSPPGRPLCRLSPAWGLDGALLPRGECSPIVRSGPGRPPHAGQCELPSPTSAVALGPPSKSVYSVDVGPACDSTIAARPIGVNDVRRRPSTAAVRGDPAGIGRRGRRCAEGWSATRREGLRGRSPGRRREFDGAGLAPISPTSSLTRASIRCWQFVFRAHLRS